MRSMGLWFKAVPLGVLLGIWIPLALAQEGQKAKPPASGGAPPQASPSPDRETKQRSYFTDLELVTQDGEKVRFYTDILKDRVVLLNFFFTNCVAACPLQGKVLTDLQPMLGDRLGQEIFIVSISVDPERDTPVAMKEYAKKLNAQKGWIFLSGKKDHVSRVIQKLGQYTEDFNEHSTAYILGNAKTDHWKKAMPNSTTQALATLLLSLAEEDHLSGRK